MFKSQLSGKQYDEGVKPVRVVTEVREVTYINPKGKAIKGFEPVKELLVGPDELDKLVPTILHKSEKTLAEKRERLPHRGNKR